MTTLELIPQLSTDAVVILSAFFALAVLVALFMVWAEHVATQWQADQYEAGQSPMEGQLTRRSLQPRAPGRVPAQRRSVDEIGGQA